MRAHLAVSLLASFVAATALAADPAVALQAGRQELQNRNYAGAVRILQDAVPAAAALAEPQRTQALAALHFYTAVALSAAGDDQKTREALEQFFDFSPQTNRIDPAKYDGRFVRHFNEVRKVVEGGAGHAFDVAYPGYRVFSDDVPRERPLAQWGEGPEMVFLGTSAERQDWKECSDDVARRSFIEEFWALRDLLFRADFLRRVAFADHMFVTEKTRGSLTDRGRVFVLLGPPRVVRQTNLTAADAATIVNKPGPIATAPGSSQATIWRSLQASEMAMANPSRDPIAKGKVERWVYSRNQLPDGFPDDQVTFKFITEEGYGENVLQRDHLVVKALHDAGRVAR